MPGINLSGNNHPLKQVASSLNHYEAFCPDFVYLSTSYLPEPVSETRFFLETFKR
jgi:hypothetical protein